MQATPPQATAGCRPPRHRPPARGGPTIDEEAVPLVEPPYIVGPPLAGGLLPAVACFRRWPASGGGLLPAVACFRRWPAPLPVAWGAEMGRQRPRTLLMASSSTFWGQGLVR